MTSYRVAFIFCKAVALSLWVGAFFGVITWLATFVAYSLGFATFGLFSNLEWIIEGLIALLLGAIAPSLSATLAGKSALEDEAIAARRALPPADQQLVRAGAGLILFVFGIASWIGALPSAYSFWTLSAPTGPNFLPLVIFQLALLTVKIAVGFLLAFWSALRRSVVAH